MLQKVLQSLQTNMISRREAGIPSACISPLSVCTSAGPMPKLQIPPCRLSLDLQRPHFMNMSTMEWCLVHTGNGVFTEARPTRSQSSLNFLLISFFFNRSNHFLLTVLITCKGSCCPEVNVSNISFDKIYYLKRFTR